MQQTQSFCEAIRYIFVLHRPIIAITGIERDHVRTAADQGPDPRSNGIKFRKPHIRICLKPSKPFL